MESLVSMAKRLGIHSNPNMSDEERKKVFHQLTEEIRKKVPVEYQKKIFEGSYEELKDAYYVSCKKVKRKIENPQQLQENFEFFEQRPQGIRAPNQNGFLWHDATEKYPLRNRFAADIQLDSPHFQEMIKKLDLFILKYKGQFKITSPQHTDRSDTLNVYLPYEITAQIAREFVTIIRPCLSENFNDYLNGHPLLEKGEIIKGVRIGPEYKHLETDKAIPLIRSMKEHLKTDIGMPIRDSNDLVKPLVWKSSLGEKESSIAVLDLAYYLAGKEGKNPFQLSSFDGKIYPKSLDINDHNSSHSQFKENSTSYQSLSPIRPTGGRLDTLLQQLSSTKDMLYQKIAHLKQMCSSDKK